MDVKEIAIKALNKEQQRYRRLAEQCAARIEEHNSAHSTILQARRDADEKVQQKALGKISGAEAIAALEELGNKEKRARKAMKLNYLKEIDKQVECEFIAEELGRLICHLNMRFRFY